MTCAEGFRTLQQLGGGSKAKKRVFEDTFDCDVKTGRRLPTG
jgi:hypothetical protein